MASLSATIADSAAWGANDAGSSRPLMWWRRPAEAMKSSSQLKPHSTGRTMRFSSRVVRAVSQRYIHRAYSLPNMVSSLVFHHAGHAGGDVAQNFIGNSICPVGVIVGGDSFPALLADEGDFIANLDAGYVCDVDDGQVHGDTSGDGRPLAAHNHAAAI